MQSFKQNIGIHVLIQNKEGKVLVLKRTHGDEQDSDMWDIPGGGIEEGEIIEDGLKREVKEETGLLIQDVKILGAYSMDDDTLGLFASGTCSKDNISLSGEHVYYTWIPYDVFLQIKEAGLHVKAAQYFLKHKTKVVLYENIC
jgi:8-oxo-dGTP diphosphatase